MGILKVHFSPEVKDENVATLSEPHLIIEPLFIQTFRHPNVLQLSLGNIPTGGTKLFPSYQNHALIDI